MHLIGRNSYKPLEHLGTEMKPLPEIPTQIDYTTVYFQGLNKKIAWGGWGVGWPFLSRSSCNENQKGNFSYW